jgi:hypothetical protein
LQDIVEALYTDAAFYQALYNGLATDGILVAQIGESTSLLDPYFTLSVDRHFAAFINGLKNLGFERITEYEEVGKIKINLGSYSTYARLIWSHKLLLLVCVYLGGVWIWCTLEFCHSIQATSTSLVRKRCNDRHQN